MAGGIQEPPPGAVMTQHQRRGFMPPQVIDLLVPPLKVGTWSGVAGALAGVAGGIARDTSPVMSGTVAGAQWFALGTSYWFTRTVAIKAWGGEDQMRPSDKTMASAIAGSAAGAVSGLTRGPARILPAMGIWAVLGAGGQMMANRAAAREPQMRDDSEGWLSKMSPLKKLTDQEYVDMMKEKMFKVEVDIALIDDRIEELRAADRRAEQEGQGKGPDSA